MESAAADRAPAAGDEIAGFVVDARIGEGAAGVVYRGRGRDGATVAIKLLRPKLVGIEDARRRFMREVAAMGQVRHPNVISVLASGVDARGPYLVSPYYPGGSLEGRLAARGPCGGDALGRLLADLAGALEALHAAGLLHRDVKPSNVFLQPNGSAVLGDLGLVRVPGASMLTQVGSLLGTLEYLAPEAILGQDPSPASDVYGLACTLYAAATGSPPFTGPNALAVGMAHLDEPAPDPREVRPDLPVVWCEAVRAGMAKAPADRPPTAAALAMLAGVTASSCPG